MPLNIDWQQILLHLFNFLILTLGLYWFLYAPIRKFMEERETFYKSRELESEDKLREAQTLLDTHKSQLQDVQQEMQAYKDKVMKETQDQVHKRLDQAKLQEEQILQDARQDANRQKQLILKDAKQEIRDFALEATRRISSGNEEDMFDDFLEHVDYEK